MKSLIIGMGIGQLYKQVLTSVGHEVVTVDSDPGKGADFTDLSEALRSNPRFDTAHICTPNFTHLKLARAVAPLCRIVFIEKPGVATEDAWRQLVIDHPQTRITMVKNNQWRSHFAYVRDCFHNSDVINLHWINRNRVPNAGTWFTTRDLAYGGVSRDLMPHLLSFVTGFCQNYHMATIERIHSEQRWYLSDLTDTEYGQVNPDGIYDVDDLAEIDFRMGNKTVKLVADWRSNTSDDRAITFNMKNSAVRYELGLCPGDAYLNMIENCFQNLNNAEFWTMQYKQDLWIHNIMERF